MELAALEAIPGDAVARARALDKRIGLSTLRPRSEVIAVARRRMN